MSDDRNPFKNPKQPTIDAAAEFLRSMCGSKLYVVEVFGSPAAVKKFSDTVSPDFETPKVTPAHMQRGMVHVRVKRPVNQHAGDLFVGQFNTEILP
jgi:hypothetical protein|uniref:Uncharacterized protein n=1 Tax=Myoviridae sp. ctshb19 TaxID=2825194 RepID=A0A8S5UGX7_9CAUD|nr:MAG TPA: hypothetical protein [Myoviridae sp. ctshb19]